MEKKVILTFLGLLIGIILITSSTPNIAKAVSGGPGTKCLSDMICDKVGIMDMTTYIDERTGDLTCCMIPTYDNGGVKEVIIIIAD